MKDISLHQSFKISNSYTRKRSIKFWIIAHLLIPREGRKYVYMCFNYLKWVDDFVDNPGIDKSDKLNFIENQLHLLSNLSKGDKVDLKSNEEYFLYYLIQYANSIINYDLIKEIRNSVESIQMDVNRLFKDGIFSFSQLNQYIDKLNRPVFNLTCIFLLPSVKIPENNKYVGKFVWKVLILRDFFEDLDSGYINISREEIEKYNLNIFDLKNDGNRFNWMKDKFSEYLNVLNEDIMIFKSIPLKVKLFWIPIYPQMIYELLKIKNYDYRFGIKHKRYFIKELKVYFQTFLLSIKFLARVF
ncbi:MAG TPA: squalene/phytoene synthase family protein [Ignavibacteriaceae bacterium]|nr:squalene/phytoene synthase family protein [Ignavibacteriaceae bacterium]